MNGTDDAVLFVEKTCREAQNLDTEMRMAQTTQSFSGMDEEEEGDDDEEEGQEGLGDLDSILQVRA